MSKSLDFSIDKLDRTILEDLQRKVDTKTKPLKALGMLEEIAIQIGLIQGTLSPSLTKPYLLVFASDHGLTEEGVSKYPSEVTQQMVYNFLNGGAAINVFTSQHGINLKIIDAGVNHSFDVQHEGFVDQKIGMGTRNIFKKAAMTRKQLNASLEAGFKIVNKVSSEDCNVIGFGEMGIGNTSSASLVMAKLLRIPIEMCVGRGTGLDDDGLKRKSIILREVIEKYPSANDPLAILQTFGGFEIVQLVGAMIQAAKNKMVILVDGFIASVACLTAYKLSPNILDYCIFSHQSEEQGHVTLLNHLDIQPILNLNMRLGEGTGCAVAYPIVASAVHFLNEMASFETAGVSTSKEEELI